MQIIELSQLISYKFSIKMKDVNKEDDNPKQKKASECEEKRIFESSPHLEHSNQEEKFERIMHDNDSLSMNKDNLIWTPK